MEEAWKSRIRVLRQEIFDLRHPKEPRSEIWTAAKGAHEFSASSPLPNSKQDVYIPHENISDVEFGLPGQLLTRTVGIKGDPACLIWDYLRGKITHYVGLDYRFNLGCALDSIEGKLLATCGLDTFTRIFSLPEYTGQVVQVENVAHTLQGHVKTVTSCTFPSRDSIISTSLDGAMKQWNIEDGSCIRTFRGHVGDVNCCAVSRAQPSIFLTGASDFTARVWDAKAPLPRDEDEPSGCIGTFDVDSREVNDVDFFPDGMCFATALNNTQVSIFDRRASCKLLTVIDDTIFRVQGGGAMKVKFSPSGRLMFVLYGTGNTYVYDIAAGNIIDSPNDYISGSALIHKLAKLPRHKNDRMSDLAVEKTEGTVGVVSSPHDSNHSGGHAMLYWPGKGKSNLIALGKSATC